MTILTCHLSDGTYFSGEDTDTVTTYHGTRFLKDLKERDWVRVLGYDPSTDFGGDKLPRYRTVVLVRENNGD